LRWLQKEDDDENKFRTAASIEFQAAVDHSIGDSIGSLLCL